MKNYTAMKVPPLCKRCGGEGVIPTGIDEMCATVCTRCEGAGYELEEKKNVSHKADSQEV